MFSDREYFLCVKRILKRHNYMNTKKLVRMVNRELGTNINAYSLARYINIYNDGTVKRKSKSSWEYVG